MRRQTGPYFFCKEIGKEMARLLWEAWGDVWGRRGSLWFVSLSITHTLISFVVCELNAPQQPVAVLPLCVTVWELCRAGGSPRSAPGRPRGRQLDYYGPHRGTDAGRRACAWISVRVNIWLPVLLGAFSKVSSSVESKMTLSLLSFLLGGFHRCKTVPIYPPSHLWSYFTDLSLETSTVRLSACADHNLCCLNSPRTCCCTEISAHCL